MEQTTINHKRNKMFTRMLGVGSLVHLVSNEILEFHDMVYSAGFGLLAFLFLSVLLFYKVNEKFIRILILFSMNIYIMILNFESISSIMVIYFVIPIIVSIFYNEVLPLVFLGVITFIEVWLLAFTFDQLSGHASMPYIHSSLFVFLFLVIVLSIVHTIYFNRLWKQMEHKNSNMERALLTKKGYLQLFFENAKDAIAVFDSDNRIIAINPAFEELYGWSLEDCIGETVQLVPPEHIHEASRRRSRILEGESFSLLETVDVKKDGTRFNAQITLSPIYDETGELVATSVISRDISYLKESEKMILQTEKLKLAGEIAAGVAHEIRNPMTVISGFIQLMQQEPNYKYQKYTKLIQSELERINLIISEFLVLAKPQASETKEFSLRKIINDVAFLFGPELRLHNVHYQDSWEVDDVAIVGAEHQIKQVFINLLKNSIEAMDELGEITLSIQLHDKNQVKIEMKDTGSGISSEGVNRVFEPFYTTKPKGTGLGLLISSKIIREHDGSLSIRSEAGHGTTATIILPIHEKGA